MKTQFWKPWGWSKSVSYASANKGSKRKFEVTVEEEVADDLIDARKSSKSNSHNADGNPEELGSIQKYLTQNALAELTLPCIDRSSSEFRSVFAGDSIKQMDNIREHINALARNGTRQTTSVPSGNESSLSKHSVRKGIRSGSPIIGKRAPVPKDLTPPPASALREALWLRLQFIIRLLPVIMADSNMRETLASSILGLLGTRVVYEDVDSPLPPTYTSALKRKSSLEPTLDVLFDVPGESLFDRLLCVLHALLGDSRPSWLKIKPGSKSAIKSPRDSAIGSEATESLQSALDSMELPGAIRRRIQAAFPYLPTSRLPSITCHPPFLSSSALLPLQSSTSTAGPRQKILLSWIPTNMSSRCRRALPSDDPDMEIDCWTLLEDGTSCPTTIGSNLVSGVTGDHANLKACSFLKGAVRVRRTDLTYIGSLDDDN